MRSPKSVGAGQQSIVLVGFMASGKSKIGEKLAQLLEMPFVDADRLIEAEHGCSVATIFRERGERVFRQSERETIARLLAGRPQVIAVGGGAFIDDHNRELLLRSARTIWLDTPFELVLPRLLRSTTRPLAANKSPAELRALWEERRESYRQAHVRIDTSDAEVDQIAARIIAALS